MRLSLCIAIVCVFTLSGLAYAASTEDLVANIEKTAVVYYWEDVVAINAYMDRECSVEEIKKISRHLKTGTYYRHNIKRYPVCIINYFIDKTKLQEKSNPWEAKGWRYEYVVNKQMKNEFLYSSVKGKIQKVWQYK